jgi:hypothetical protein
MFHTFKGKFRSRKERTHKGTVQANGGKMDEICAGIDASQTKPTDRLPQKILARDENSAALHLHRKTAFQNLCLMRS